MRSAARQVLNWYASRRIRALGRVAVARPARVNFRRISMKPGCGLAIGRGSIIEANLIFDRDGASILIGDRTFIGASSIISAERIIIGNDVLISWGCTIVDHDSHPMEWMQRQNDVLGWFVGSKDWSNVVRSPVVVNDRAWIGFNVAILKGVTIGEGAVVGACSVVTKSVPPYCLVAGNPAKIIRKIPGDDRSGG